LARLLRDDIAATYSRDLPSAAACLDDDFAACIAHLKFPLGHRRAIRTTNLLERLFGEERRRTKVIPHAFGERAVLKLMYAALIRAAERWRGIKVSEFEQRQLKAIRDEIDKDFTLRNAPAAGTTAQSYSARGIQKSLPSPVGGRFTAQPSALLGAISRPLSAATPFGANWSGNSDVLHVDDLSYLRLLISELLDDIFEWRRGYRGDPEAILK